MLTREKVEQAIRVQRTGYELIRWLYEPGRLRSMSFAENHAAASETRAAAAWLRRNRDRIPAELLPTDEDWDAFANMLTSFQLTSADAGWRAPLPDGACTCRWCTNVVWRLGWPTQPTREDRRSAEWMKLHGLRDLVDEIGAPLLLSDLETLAKSTGQFGQAIAWVAYASELVRRCDYASNRSRYRLTGHGLIVLWRTIAYDSGGHVAKDFELTWDRVAEAKAVAVAALNAEVARLMAVKS